MAFVAAVVRLVRVGVCGVARVCAPDGEPSEADFVARGACEFVAGVLFVEGGIGVRHIERILGFGRITRFIFGNLFHRRLSDTFEGTSS